MKYGNVILDSASIMSTLTWSLIGESTGCGKIWLHIIFVGRQIPLPPKEKPLVALQETLWGVMTSVAWFFYLLILGESGYLNIISNS